MGRILTRSTRLRALTYEAVVGPVSPISPQPATDPNFSDVELLLDGDGTNGQTTINDKSSAARSISFFGTAQLRTDLSPKFGTACFNFSGSFDYVQTTDTFGTSGFWIDYTGPLTIDAWVNTDSLSGTNGILGTRYDSGSPYGIQLLSNSNGSIQFNGYDGGGGGAEVSLVSSASVHTVGNWAFVRVIREAGGTWRLGVGGVEEDSVAESSNVVDHSNGRFRLGNHRSDGSGALWYDGQLDDVRVTVGVARSITELPTEAFPTS